MKFKARLLILFLLFTLSPLFADGPARIDTIDHKKNGYRFGLVLPVNYQPQKKYILGVCLHGLGGNGIEFAQKLGYYTRFMNILLACPNGNIPDPNRKATRWGYESSNDYILNFVNLIKESYNTYPEIVLIGFSQGGNQGILTSLLYPSQFPYFIGISGGYYNLPSELIPVLSDIKMLLISGDTGSGEIYTKNVLDYKFKLYKSHSGVYRKTIKGEEHYVSSKMAYSSLRWYASVNKAYKKGFWIFQGDYYQFFQQAETLRREGNFKESIELYHKSFKYNPVFPPSHLGYARANLLVGSLTHFRKSFFKVLELYSLFPDYEPHEVFELLEEIYKTIYNDKSLKEFFLRFFSDKIESYDDSILPIYKAEVYFLMAKIALSLQESDQYSMYIDKAKFYYSQVDQDDYLYKIGSVSEKLEIIRKL